MRHTLLFALSSQMLIFISLTFSGCFEPFPELPELPEPPPPQAEDAALDMRPTLDLDMMARPDLGLDMGEPDLGVEIEMGPIEDMAVDMMVDMMVDMEPPPRFEAITTASCQVSGSFNSAEGAPLMEAPTCPASLSEPGREWLRVDPPLNVGFNVSGSDPFSQLSPDSTPAVRSRMMSPYLIMRREVSLGDYARCVSEGGCAPHSEEVTSREGCLASKAGALNPDHYPVNCVDWSQAQAFCEWAGGRLPSEMEWELAVTLHRAVFPISWSIDQGRPEFQRYLSSMNDAFCAYANYGNCQPLNPLGLQVRPTCHEYPPDAVTPSLPEPVHLDERLFCDASGNLAEWTLDDEDIVSNTPQSGEPVVRGESVACVAQDKVTRGGSFTATLPEEASQSAPTLYSLFFDISYLTREGELCTERLEQVGFRCVIPYP